jgi:dihydroflavonol-4-reductase
MKVYITGANGFVGKNLIRRLDESGFDAWAVVRTKTSRIKEIILDLNSCSEKEILEKLNKADCIVHLAANADFRNVFGKEVYEVNCLVNLAMANICKKLNVHFIFASNALIAGMDQEHISLESPDNPGIPYNISKYISEEYIAKQVNDYCILRIGGIYGYKGPEHLFLNRAIDKALITKELFNIHNDGLGRRNYIYVEDLCSWIINLIKNKTKGKYLIAGKEILSLKEIFLQMNDIFLEGKGQFSLNVSTKGNDQVIETILPNIKMHDYRMAFSDIKRKAQSL